MARSAGILAYRIVSGGMEFFLVHPGGPYFMNKDIGAWSIPKGEYAENEDPLDAAKREFTEETGVELQGQFIPLTPIKQKGGKLVTAWAICQDIAETECHSNEFNLEWPARSGRFVNFPEIDKAAWFEPSIARQKINPAQAALIDEIIAILEKK